MTNEQLTQNVMELVAYKAKAEEEHELFKNMLQTMQADIKATKTLTEDVHIMAINMENMQKTLDNAVKKIDIIEKKDYNEYKEKKKLVSDNFLSGIVGAFVTGLIGLITYFINKMKEGGM